mmetsp:Transcript_80136/g.226839  ORF Transcript_80136/g.226839 Transcript_80136/m.226839 type:complete len:226 (+) Transcript_80136:434-1111(+)
MRTVVQANHVQVARRRTESRQKAPETGTRALCSRPSAAPGGRKEGLPRYPAGSRVSGCRGSDQANGVGSRASGRRGVDRDIAGGGGGENGESGEGGGCGERGSSQRCLTQVTPPGGFCCRSKLRRRRSSPRGNGESGECGESGERGSSQLCLAQATPAGGLSCWLKLCRRASSPRGSLQLLERCSRPPSASHARGAQAGPRSPVARSAAASTWPVAQPARQKTGG